MNDIGPFQDIIAVGWQTDEKFEFSDTGWSYFLSAGRFNEKPINSSFEGAPFSWTVRASLGIVDPWNPTTSYLRVYARRVLVLPEPRLIEVVADFDPPSGTVDAATVVTPISLYQETMRGTWMPPAVVGSPTSSGVVGPGRVDISIGLNSGWVTTTSDRPRPTNLDVTFTFSNI